MLIPLAQAKIEKTEIIYIATLQIVIIQDKNQIGSKKLIRAAINIIIQKIRFTNQT
jgi:hypothetical protein